MKWVNVEPSPGQFSFQAGDGLVAFAEQNGMRVRGHTLVWHTQLAPWVAGLSAEALHAAMLRHITGEVSHWKGKISQWDVVNEAFADGRGGGLRKDSPFTALGPTFIEDAFRAAHEADPAAQLFYNDYALEDPGIGQDRGRLPAGAASESGGRPHRRRGIPDARRSEALALRRRHPPGL